MTTKQQILILLQREIDKWQPGKTINIILHGYLNDVKRAIEDLEIADET